MAVALVAGLQLAIMMAVAGAVWLTWGVSAAQAVAAGGGCALAGTLTYAVSQKMVPGRSASRLLWGHVLGEVAKVAVALGLLIWELSSDPGHAGQYLGGFVVALLAYPMAILFFKK